MSVINTNITSMIGQQNLNKSQNALQTSMERLSSGLRINSAKDDAAGQAIANRMTAQITGLAQAQRNANDGISIAQTAEGGLNQVNDNLQRIRELTVQAQNGTNSSSDLGSIQDEINQRLEEINRISRETDFNGTRVLSEDAQKLTIQVGSQDGQVIEVNLSTINSETLGLATFNVDGSVDLENELAELSDLPAGGTQTGNQYTVTTENQLITASDAFDRLEDGNAVTITGGANANTYTYDADNDNFTFASTETAAGDTIANGDTLAATLAAALEAAGDSFTFTTPGGSQTNVTVNEDGNLFAENGDQLYISNGELTAAPTDGGSTAATLENLTELAVRTAGAEFTAADGVTYEVTTAHVNETNPGDGDGTAGVLSVEGQTISREALLENVTDGTVGQTTSVAIGDSIVGGDIDLDADGVSSNAEYVAADGTFTTETDSTVTYVQGEDESWTLDGETVYVDAEGALTTDATSPGERTESPLAALDAALSQIDSLRSELGAVQNRFGDAINNLSTNETNLSAARSRIEDADYAVEVANMTRAQILQQAGTSVLAQANQIPQSVLSLLG